MHRFQISNQAVANAVSALGGDGFWLSVHSMIAQVVNHQMSAAFEYVDSNPPRRLFDSEGNAERDDVHAILTRIGYLISPYYNGLIRARAPGGFYHIDSIAPDEFRLSKYFEVYYERKQVEDEGLFMCTVTDRLTIVVMVERHETAERFSQCEIEALTKLHPIVTALVEQHYHMTAQDQIRPEETCEERSVFMQVVDRFGSEVLSRREREVTMLMLRGHSTKSAARMLDISPETERVHRRRLYAKLGVGSHSELFWIFLQSADYLDVVGDGDPLLAYLKDNRPNLLA